MLLEGIANTDTDTSLEKYCQYFLQILLLTSIHRTSTKPTK